MKYILELTEKQAEVTVKALELLTRVGVNQLSLVAWEMNPETADLVRDELRRLEDLLTRETRHSWGILHEKVPVVSRIAYDIMQVVRYQLGTDRKAEAEAKGVAVHHNVWLNDPMFVHEGKNPPKIKRKK